MSFAYTTLACCKLCPTSKLVQIYAPFYINAPPNEESPPQLCAAKLTQNLGTKVDQGLLQWLD